VAGYVDIHTHVLPGIDDGPSDVDGAIAMARAAAEAGTAILAATPHLRADFPDVHIDELAGRCQELRDVLEREQIPVRIVAAAEVSLVWALEALEADDEQLRLATFDQRGSDMLVETPSGSVFGLDRMLYEIRARGIRVTLAHPERSPEFQRAPERLDELVHQGVLLQVNAGSLADAGRRSGVRKLAERLCTSGLAHALASDGHRADSWRPVTKLPRGIEALTDLVGSERALWMASDAARAIVDGERLPEAPPVVAGRRRSWLFSRT
jgi:protein-tyrosine phosphatase